MMAVLGVLAGNAQVHKIAIANPQAPDKVTYMEVYDFDYVEEQPEFPGGERGLINFINDTREYPYNAYKQRIQGRVLCSFIIETDGKVSHVDVFRSSGNASLDREALRVIKKMPKWEAGRISSEKVNVRCILPIAFRL
ncbi:MAG: energy transducer TonB [Muribaculaceae bacterium]|nr:energy transducer TonB [Muribaculaceae bacterium]